MTVVFKHVFLAHKYLSYTLSDSFRGSFAGTSHLLQSFKNFEKAI